MQYWYRWQHFTNRVFCLLHHHCSDNLSHSYGGFMVLSLIGAYFRVPETKNRVFAEIDILFKNKVKARKFKNTKVDLATQAVIEE